MAVKTAVIGAGVMGREHLKRLAEVPEAQVVGVVDPHLESARKAAEGAGGGARAFVDMEEMLAAVEPEYVVVASPARYHAQQCLAAYAAGAHVLCEKPLCMNLAEAGAIEAAAKRAGKLFTMGFQMRQRRDLRALRAFLAGGGLGQIYHTRVWGGHHMGYPWGRFHHRREMSFGGVMAATIVHPLDAAYWVLAAPEPVTVTASTFRRLDKMPDPPINFEGTAREVTVEDFAHAHVRFADGSSMSIEGNWLLHPSPRSQAFDINGVLGVARDREPHVELEQKEKVVPHKLDYTPLEGSDTTQEHREFLAAIAGKGEPVVTFREALNVQRILVGIYESAAKGAEVRV